MASGRNSDVDLAGRVARLTAGQRECLDLVDDHATSKEIARELGISRHTVDARLRAAIQTLGVSSRREAAVIFRAAMQAEAYQPLAYQSSRIVTDCDVAEDGRHDDATDIGDTAVPRAAPPAGQGHFPAAGGSPVAWASHAPGGERLPVEPGVGMVADSAVWAAPLPDQRMAFRRPPLRLWGGANDLSLSQRIAGILLVTLAAMLAFGVFLSGIEALTLLRS